MPNPVTKEEYDAAVRSLDSLNYEHNLMYIFECLEILKTYVKQQETEIEKLKKLVWVISELEE